MDVLVVGDVMGVMGAVWEFLSAPIAATDFSQWRDFWARQVLDDRYLVCYFLPLVPVLLLFPARWFRQGIVLTGLAFMVYVFGVVYAIFWVVTCYAFYRLSERFVHEAKRTDVLKIGPPLAVISIITGWYLLVQGVQHIRLPLAFNGWLVSHVPWVFPLGAREFGWEPFFRGVVGHGDDGRPAQLFHAMFYNPHNIGVAYLVWRMAHYFSELKRETIPACRRTFLNFLSYLCYAPNLIQGPIERYMPFQEEMDGCHARRGWGNVPPAVGRIFWGVGKSFVSIWYFQPILWHEMGLGNTNAYYLRPETLPYWLVYGGIFLEIYALYLEFSGYCDVSAGIARLLGYRQVENFNRVWMATSLRDFWRRWHISLSMILRDYIYIPLGGNRKHVTFNLCVTFFICGIWHAPIAKVGIWGIIMGLMLAVNQRWVVWMKRLDAREGGFLPAVRRNWLKLRPLPQVCAWLVTMHAFVFSLLVFFGAEGALRVLVELVRRPVVWFFGG